MIAVNLQTSFLTPPFGFALFYLRGVAPPEVTTMHIYRGVVPFVVMQLLDAGRAWRSFPGMATWLPEADLRLKPRAVRRRTRYSRAQARHKGGPVDVGAWLEDQGLANMPKRSRRTTSTPRSCAR